MSDLKGSGEYMGGFVSRLADEIDNDYDYEFDEKQQYQSITKNQNNTNYVSLLVEPHVEYAQKVIDLVHISNIECS